MLSLRFEPSLPADLAVQLRDPIERAAGDWSGWCEAFVYAVGPAHEVIVRLTYGQAVLPLLLRGRDLEPERVFATVKGALGHGDF